MAGINIPNAYVIPGISLHDSPAPPPEPELLAGRRVLADGGGAGRDGERGRRLGQADAALGTEVARKAADRVVSAPPRDPLASITATKEFEVVVRAGGRVAKGLTASPPPPFPPRPPLSSLLSPPLLPPHGRRLLQERA